MWMVGKSGLITVRDAKNFYGDSGIAHGHERRKALFTVLSTSRTASRRQSPDKTNTSFVVFALSDFNVNGFVFI